MVTKESNPLNDLFVDNQPLDLPLLAKIILPYVQLERDPPKVDFTLAWEQLTNEKKILAYLLGRKALCEALKNAEVYEYEEKATPNEVEEDTKIKGGSVRPMLRDLLKKRFAKKNRGYFVPNNALPHIEEYLCSEEE